MGNPLFRRLARGTIRLANWLVDGAVLAAVVIIVCFTAFTVMDNNQVMNHADTSKMATYKPVDDGASLEELQAINPDVLGWLTVYGTGIDYPVVQGDDNEKYVNTDAAGEFALSGALFLDYRDAPDFSGASTVIYGHHMENSLMFGDLDKYADADYLEAHCTGNLYYAGADHGLEVVGYLTCDANDESVYSATVGENPSVEAFVNYLRSHAKVWRVEPSVGDRLVLLSTCGKGTNDRHVVVCRITQQTFEDPYPDEQIERTLSGTAEGAQALPYIGIGLLLFLLVAWVVGGSRSGKKRDSADGREGRRR